MNFMTIRCLFACAALVVSSAIVADADVGKTTGINAGEEINWQVIAGGGSTAAVSTGYRLSGTVGQTASGTGASTSYQTHHGFWQVFEGASCCTLAGNANGDDRINVGDAVYIITYIFREGPAPPCEAAADANADGKINIGDAVYIITYIFREGPAPMCP